MLTYKEAGVDKEEGYRAVEKMKRFVSKTYNAQVLNGLGSFGALYELGKYQNPVLVSGTDGVGTKLKLTFESGIYNTIGIDAVAMCANDILCHGAKPLFFLDYIACGKLNAEIAAEIVSGMSQACIETGMALIGGETAEMPGFYQAGEYDIAGFAVGVVEKEKIITGSSIKEGDVLIGLASSGIHSNGFSAVRKLIPDINALFEGQPVIQELLKPTKLYVNSILKLLEVSEVHGMAHITGGGLIENVPRIIPEGLCAVIDEQSIPALPIFKHLHQLGMQWQDMWGTFNMGVGFVIALEAKHLDIAMNSLKESGELAFVLGHVEKGEQKLCIN